MTTPLINLDKVGLTFGGAPLLVDASLTIGRGDRVALVGRNGSGKSTLLKIAAGLVEPQHGTVFRQPDATLRYLEQDPVIRGFADIRTWVNDALGPVDEEHRVDYLLEHLDLDGAAPPERLSGGELRRAALARVLAPRPDILLLDEPTNHLDLTAIEWLEDELSRLPAAIVMISHDRRFLENVSRSTIWLDRGYTRRLARGFAHFEAWRDKLLEEEEREIHKLGRRIVTEEHWLRYGVTARRKRNMRRLGELTEMRAAFRNRHRPRAMTELSAADDRPSGKLVIEADAVTKSFGGRAIVKDFSIRINRGDRVGIIGQNGIGKTTLLKMLTGEIAPDNGSVRHGANLMFATLDQRRAALDLSATLADQLTGGGGDQVMVDGQPRHVIGYMKDFLFLPEQARTPVRELSGGERARLVLAMILARPSNVLVFDEPTNDLDMETLDLLQELIAGYSGTVLLVSHDRDFLDRTVTSVVAPQGSGRWTEFAGGYADMLAERHTEAPGPRKAPPDRKAKRDTTEGRQPQTAPKKLSYKQKYALETLPDRIEKMQASIGEIENSLADNDLFRTDAASFNRLADELRHKRSELEELEQQWLELEILREELESRPSTKQA